MWIIIDTIHTAYFYGPQEHFLYNEFFVVQKAHVYLNKNMGPTMRFVCAFPLLETQIDVCGPVVTAKIQVPTRKTGPTRKKSSTKFKTRSEGT
jgi:hypothetical protein